MPRSAKPIKPASHAVAKYSARQQFLERLRSKLSNALFLAMHPKKALAIRRNIGSYTMRRMKLNVIKHELSNALRAKKIVPVRVMSRTKTTKSIHEKIAVQEKPEKRVYQEAIGLRIIVRNKRDCYAVARLIMELGTSGDILRHDDYISAPRTYGYEAIHIVTKHFGYPVEVQIRSTEMERKVQDLDDAMGAYRQAKEKIKRKSLDLKAERLSERVSELAKKPDTSPQDILRAIKSSGIPEEFRLNAARSLRRQKLITHHVFDYIRSEISKSIRAKRG